jgi:hypothetical protein
MNSASNLNTGSKQAKRLWNLRMPQTAKSSLTCKFNLTLPRTSSVKVKRILFRKTQNCLANKIIFKTKILNFKG